MRVIAGTRGGRRLAAPPGRGTRPTSDRVREALFSSLGAEVVGARVLDLYAGSGALGIEALSRGADSVVFVERARAAVTILRKNLHALDLEACVIMADAAELPRALPRGDEADAFDSGAPFTVVVIDPPYDEPMTTIVSVLERFHVAGLIAPTACVVVERDRRSHLAVPEWLTLERRRTYGDTVLLYLRIVRSGKAAFS